MSVIVSPRKNTLQTLHNGVLWSGLRNILVEEGHNVCWIFDNTRGEIEIPDLQVEGWVKPQEVLEHILSVSTWHGDGLFSLYMSSNLTHYSNYTTLLRMYPLHYLCCEVETRSCLRFHCTRSTVHLTLCDPPHAPRHARCPRLLQHRHFHCRLVSPDCRQLHHICHPYPGSSCPFFLIHPSHTPILHLINIRTNVFSSW